MLSSPPTSSSLGKRKSNLLVSGTDTSRPNHVLPAFTPPVAQLALAATLVVHPSVTTRASSAEKVRASNEALRFLRYVNRLVGPVNAGFGDAFSFSSSGITRRGAKRARRDGTPTSDSDTEDGRLNTDLAGAGSIWSRADDFWSVVGWAFNCSVRHQSRWNRWKIWLGFMLDMLEDDLAERMAVDPKTGLAVTETIAAEESIIAHYLRSTGDGRAGKRRLMRAILADGSKKSVAEFGEIWKNETDGRQKQEEPMLTKPKKLNFDEDEFGDYLDVDRDEEIDEDSTLLRSRSASQHTAGTRKASESDESQSESESESEHGDEDKHTPHATTLESIDTFGGMESMKLRQRFLALLINLCACSDAAFLELEDLVDLYTEFIRPLPLSIFTQLASPYSPYLDEDSQSSLNQMLLRPLIASEAPVYKKNALNQADFEKHFLPYAANNTNTIDNAKVSLLVEGLMRLLWKHIELQATKHFRATVIKGIAARKKKASYGGRKKTGVREKEENLAKDALHMSASRMMLLLEVMERIQSQKPK
ncbi:hypothetical protein LTR66_006645 [Elasticomyces elasticus]|nr:hypothetical protein LTR66_006645 [Elasticomyces elasticus]